MRGSVAVGALVGMGLFASCRIPGTPEPVELPAAYAGMFLSEDDLERFGARPPCQVVPFSTGWKRLFSKGAVKFVPDPYPTISLMFQARCGDTLRSVRQSISKLKSPEKAQETFEVYRTDFADPVVDTFVARDPGVGSRVRVSWLATLRTCRFAMLSGRFASEVQIEEVPDGKCLYDSLVVSRFSTAMDTGYWK